MGAVIPFGTALRGPYTPYVDNTAAQGYLTRGFSRDEAGNLLCSTFWVEAGKQGAGPFFFRVTSEANVADARSRETFHQAEEAGWRPCHPNFEPLWGALAQAAANEFLLTPARNA